MRLLVAFVLSCFFLNVGCADTSGGDDTADAVAGTGADIAFTGGDGQTGADGATGATGATGTDGTTGVTGTDGTTGSTGATGTDGTTGATGATGTDGTTGVTGTDGTDGTAGTTSTTGTDGTDGTDGTTGNPGTSGQIQAARDAADGVADLQVEGALITEIKPAVAEEAAGFFIQGEQAGPALFVAVDPATHQVGVGDLVNLTITEMGTDDVFRYAVAVSGVQSVGKGNPSAMAQDLSNAKDVVSNLDSYESELVNVKGTITGPLGYAGPGFRSGTIETAGIQGDANLLVRIPLSLEAAVDMSVGCGFDLTNVAVWRHQDKAQLSPYLPKQVALSGCPAPTVIGAKADSSTQVTIEFDRNIDPASISADGSQFTFTEGVQASAAKAVGRTVVVTTSSQPSMAELVVTVATTVKDTLGTALNAEKNQTSFTGYLPPAKMLINEVNANIKSSCDMVDLRVIEGGLIEGFKFYQRSDLIVVFPKLVVEKNDILEK